MGIILNRLFRNVTLIGLSFLCCIAVSGTCIAQPAMGLYFDEKMYYRPAGAFEIFDAQLILHRADTYVSGVEYCLETPSDPNHYGMIIMEIINHDDLSIDLGYPWNGHSMTFWPPLDGLTDYIVLCTYKCLMLQGCDDGMSTDLPIVVSPHPDSGFLRGTSYPGHELFDIIGETSYLCPSHWPPMLSDVQVCSPRSMHAWFNQCVYSWNQSYDDNFILYTATEPHDTIAVIEAAKDSPLDEDYDDFFVYLESPMQEGVEYTLQASAGCECNGYATSTINFVYEGGFAPGPDLAVTYWINNELGPIESYDYCAPFEVDYVVRNLGTAGSGPFLSRISGAPREGGESILVWSDSCGGLPVDGTLEGTALIQAPLIPTTTGYLRFETDHTGLITEANEEDNHKDALYWNTHPLIISIEDVPDDCGRQVELTFHGSWLEIERPEEGDLYRILRLARISEEWEEVHQLEATSDTFYTCTVPTTIDSSGASENYWTVFTVEYLWGSPRQSCPDSGYSVDDLGPVAAHLLTSSIETTDGSIMLKWAVTESPDFGDFSISRAETGGSFRKIGSLQVPPGESSFEFEDRTAEPGVDYIYRVEYIDDDETQVLFETEPVGLPRLPFALHQNRPNPFNPSTEIGFSLPGPSTVTLDIYDISGKRVRRLLDENRPAGKHSVHWDGLDDNGSQVVSGVYFYRLTAGKSSHSRKMILIR